MNVEFINPGADYIIERIMDFRKHDGGWQIDFGYAGCDV